MVIKLNAQKDSTKILQSAIDKINKAGGGEIVLSKGIYNIGTVFLCSNLTVTVQKNAVLRGSCDLSKYNENVHHQRYRDEKHMDKCLIFAVNAENITLKGEGIIDGNGLNFAEKGERPMLLRMLSCKNIILKDLKLYQPVSWCTAFLDCEKILCTNLDIFSRNFGNGDGLDFDNCINVRVSDCSFDCSDDCICLQNSNPELVCRDIVVTNCTMKSQWAGVRIGLLTRNIIENAVFSNIVMRDINCSGFKIQCCEGGKIRNISITSIMMTNVPRPIFVTLSSHNFGADYKDSDLVGECSDILVSNLIADYEGDGYVEDSGFVFMGSSQKNIRNVKVSNVIYKLNGKGNRVETMPLLGNERPEYFCFHKKLPSEAIYLSYCENIRFDNVEILFKNPTQKSTAMAFNSQECFLNNIRL